MRFDPMLCPECGGAAEEVVEMVLGGAGITLDPETGEYEEAGDTSISWDSQERLLQDGKVRLVCHNQHEWLAEEVYPTSIVCQHLAAAGAKHAQVLITEEARQAMLAQIAEATAVLTGLGQTIQQTAAPAA